MTLADYDVTSTTGPYLRIVQPPNERFIFRYKSDKKKHGHLRDIFVELKNFDGNSMERIKFVCTLYRPANYRFSTHELISHSGGIVEPEYGFPLLGSCTAKFSGIVVLNRKQATIKAEIKDKATQEKEHLTKRYVNNVIRREFERLDLRKVQLRFDVYRNVNDEWVRICQPALSNYISDSRKKADPANAAEGSLASSCSPRSDSTSSSWTDTNNDSPVSNRSPPSAYDMWPNEYTYYQGYAGCAVSSTAAPYAEVGQNYDNFYPSNLHESSRIGLADEYTYAAASQANTSHQSYAGNTVSSSTDSFTYSDAFYDDGSLLDELINNLCSSPMGDTIDQVINNLGSNRTRDNFKVDTSTFHGSPNCSALTGEFSLTQLLDGEGFPDCNMEAYNAVYHEMQNFVDDSRMETDCGVPANDEDRLDRSSLLLVVVMYKICRRLSGRMATSKIRHFYTNEIKNGRLNVDILIRSYPETFKLFVTCVEELNMVDLLDIENNRKRACFVSLCEIGTVDLVCTLLPTLIRLGLNPNVIDDRGDTVLHTLIKKNKSRKCVEVLLNAVHANSVQLDMQTMNHDGLTPLQLAKKLNRTGIVKALKKSSAQSGSFRRLQEALISGIRKLNISLSCGGRNGALD